jgi:hypothetical protein
MKELSLLQNKSLKVHFSANVGRNLFIIIYVFTFLNEEDLCVWDTVGLAECNEEYLELIEPFEYIMKFIRENRIFKFKGLEFVINYSFTSDMKMMLIVNGLACPTSEYYYYYLIPRSSAPGGWNPIYFKKKHK